MRRVRRIVNEMEFRMWHEAKSFSPSVCARTMKGFPPMHWLAEAAATPSTALFVRSISGAYRTFSKSALR
jgi:hypothetical protein